MKNSYSNEYDKAMSINRSKLSNEEKWYIRNKTNTINHFFLKYVKQKKYIIIKRSITNKILINYKCKNNNRKEINYMFIINPNSKRLRIIEKSDNISKIYYSIKSLNICQRYQNLLKSFIIFLRHKERCLV